jgi:hypothetical protein
MRPGENGEVILEDKLDAHYVRMGALVTGNFELFSAVKTAVRERDETSTGEPILHKEHRQGVVDGLNKLSGRFMYGLISTVTFTYPQYAEALLNELEHPESSRS